MRQASSPEDYIDQHPAWQEELQLLRTILLETDLEETIKWGAPVYTIGGKNVVGLGAFKSYVGLWFYQGYFLGDEAQVLMNAQEGKTKAMRQWRFQGKSEMNIDLIRAYILEAIDNQIAGLEVKPNRQKKEVVLPDELKAALGTVGGLSEAFDRFTPGKQREFAEYISEAKREATRQRRLQKVLPMIMEGRGLNDQYR